MIIRSLEKEDLPEIHRIHEAHYNDEFKFPDLKQFHCIFVVEHNGVIVTAGGVRPIAEGITFTDKSLPTRCKVKAMRMMLSAQLFTAGKFGYNQLHAFVQNQTYVDQLKRTGFQQTVGEALVLDFNFEDTIYGKR